MAFAAETDDVLANAREKLARKNADMVVANDVTPRGCGLWCGYERCDADYAPKTRDPLEKMDKRAVADAILDRVLEIKRS